MAYTTWALTYTLERHYTCTSTKGTRNENANTNKITNICNNY